MHVSPIKGVGVEAGDLQRASIRLVGQLMDHHPILILSSDTHLREIHEKERFIQKSNREC